MIYIFFREHAWYLLELNNDQEVIENVKSNPGTIRVETVSGKVIWEQKGESK